MMESSTTETSGPPNPLGAGAMPIIPPAEDQNGSAGAGVVAAGVVQGKKGIAKWRWQEAWEEADRELENAGMMVSVKEPQASGGLMSRHITYLVETQPNGWSTRHRYTDFVWLRENLITRYPGLLIPTLPRKSVVGKAAGQTTTGLGGEFIRLRMRLLGIFLEQCVQIPYLRTDVALIGFLSATTEHDWENAKAVASAANIMTDTSPGSRKWLEEVSKAEVPPNADRVMADLKNQLARLDQVIPIATEASREVWEIQKDYLHSMHKLSEKFQAWNIAEEELGQMGRYEYPNRHSAETMRLMQGASDSMANWAQVLEFQPTILCTSLSSLLSYLCQQVEGFRELIRMRDEFVKQLYSTEKVLARHREQYQAFDNPGLVKKSIFDKTSLFNAFSNRSSVEDAIIADETQIEMCKKSIDMITKAFFYSEIDRFNFMRQKIILELLQQLSGSQFQFSRRLGQIWHACMDTLDMDPQVCLDSAKHVILISSTVSKLVAPGSGITEDT